MKALYHGAIFLKEGTPMDLLAKANSWPMYLLACFVVVFVLLEAAVFLRRAYREGTRMGMSGELLKKVIVSSATFSIVPSIGILVGVLALAPALGVPLPWIRLSVIGALHYEGSTANNIAKGLGLGDLPSTLMTGADYASIAWAMTLGILWGAVFVLFFFKMYQGKLTRATGKSPKLSSLLFSAMFVGMVSVYVGDAFSNLRTLRLSNGSIRSPNILPVFAVACSVVAMVFFTWLIEKKKIKWLENFSFSFAMLFGMAMAVVGQFIFPALSTFVD
jgi:hypothetical protein